MAVEGYGSRPAPSLCRLVDFIETLTNTERPPEYPYGFKLRVSSLQEPRNSVLSLALVLPSTVQERMLAPGPSG